ncbi:HAD-IA family hydrolase [Lederbergia sp. NSJ-179]|uniref:HAD-IA family hydrolase n=1 Tax=Lederbergia sp. NSJ-179 TaxID=2931402 RepID=UPI001FD2A3BE|nr:HAD-IA family hydrolase [Lederbergia sp. NSJ-179]MCJ7840470.1 HAD-IA family hydrolase [Lederbergia sp. NSJ-179]
MNILWDFDGTLFDTYPVFTKVLKQVMNTDISEEEIYAQIKVSFSRAIQYFELTEEQMNNFIVLYNQLPTNEFKPFKGVEQILQYARKNVIMTHSSRMEVLKIINNYGWAKYFDEIVTADDGFPRKPHTAAYEYLQQKYSLDLVIGDRLIDIIPAKKLGIKTCLFQNEEWGADYYLSSYEEFFEQVKEC